MRRLPGALWAYAAAAALCFASAWWVKTHPSQTVEAADGISIHPIEEGSVTAVAFDSPAFALELSKREDAAGSYWWVEGFREGEGEQDGAFSFKGGSSADRLVGMLEPPRARRVVEAEDVAGRLAEYGLDPAQGQLTIEAGGTSYGLTLGTPEAGGRSSYGYLPETETLYLLERRWVDLILEGDGRLMDRRLYLESSLGFEAAQASLQEPGSARTVMASIDKKNPAQPIWVSGETPVAWVDSSFGLAVRGYAEPGEWAGAIPVLEVRYTLANNAGEIVVPIRRDDAAPKPRYLAKTRYTREPVELRASSVERLLAALQIAP